MGRGEGLKGLPWVPEDQAQAAGLRPAGWRSPHVRDVIRTKEKTARTLPGKQHQRRSCVGTTSPEGPQEPWGTSSPALRPLGPQPSCSFPPARYPLSRDPAACRPLHQSLPLCILEAHPDQPAPDTPGPERPGGWLHMCVAPRSLGLRFHCSSWAITGWGQGPLMRPHSGMEQTLPQGLGDREQCQVAQLLPGLVPDCPGSLWASAGSHPARRQVAPTAWWQWRVGAPDTPGAPSGSRAASSHSDPQWALWPAAPRTGHWLPSAALRSPYRAQS